MISAPELESGRYLDRFRLERRLGSGSFGSVWLAVDEADFGFRKKVALKILSDAGSPERTEALIREARICGHLNHPNIIDVYGVMSTGGTVFIVMEYIEGRTLRELRDDLNWADVRFPRSVIVDIAISVAEPLYHAWSATDDQGRELRVVHRDLKPANVMLSTQGVVKVGDFGIAKAVRDTVQTARGRVKGTPAYMAPELMRARRDFRPPIDLWALGVILWELCSGRRFYEGVPMSKLAHVVRTRRPADEAAEAAAYFPELGPIIERLLQRDPGDRYQSALNLAQDLRKVRYGMGVVSGLLEFGRLVRAGEAEARTGSLAELPVLPERLTDWEPLVLLAKQRETGESPVVPALPDDDAEAPERPAPDAIGPQGGGVDGTQESPADRAAALQARRDAVRHPAPPRPEAPPADVTSLPEIEDRTVRSAPAAPPPAGPAVGSTRPAPESPRPPRSPAPPSESGSATAVAPEAGSGSVDSETEVTEQVLDRRPERAAALWGALAGVLVVAAAVVAVLVLGT